MRYRIRTLKEMISAYGQSWDRNIEAGWINDMNRFLGEYIPDQLQQDAHWCYEGRRKRLNAFGYIISKAMIVPVDTAVPSHIDVNYFTTQYLTV